MSLTSTLLLELQSVVLSYLTARHLLSTCTHICQHISRSALTPPCFRTSLLLDDRAINELPILPSSTFSLLTQATALDIRYGDAANERCCRAFFSTTSDRSLLHFTRVTALSLVYTNTWDFLNLGTPFALLSALLTQCDVPVLPLLTHLVIVGVSEYESDSRDVLSPVTAIPTLTHVTLVLDMLEAGQFRPLLQLPNLQIVQSDSRFWGRSVKQSADELAMCKEFKDRGVKLVLRSQPLDQT